MDEEIKDFAESNRINGYFVNAVIETAAKLKNEIAFNDSLFSLHVLSRVGKQQKESITEAVNDWMENDPEIFEEFDKVATESDFARVPQFIKSRFPKERHDWKVKDIEINTRWIMYFDKISETVPFLNIVKNILLTFRPQILEL